MERHSLQHGQARARRSDSGKDCGVMSAAKNYVGVYLAPIPTGPRQQRGLAQALALADKHYSSPTPTVESAELPLQRLFSAGVECGHMEARAELKRRVVVVDETLAELSAIRDRARGDREQLANDLLSAQMRIGSLEAMLGATKARIEELESSTTWRATATVRQAGHRAKLAAARLHARWAMLRQWPRYVGLAGTVL